ncbi:MAG TPA: SRPBCC family protein [Tepidisphaeraceae bacterium]|nr:SRPBCC family protein [Tepidisphaeraceae bacterium]
MTTQNFARENVGDSAPRVNMGSTERWASGLIGGALAVYGLRKLSVSGLLAAGIGAVIVRRAVGGHCPLYNSMNIDTRRSEPARPEEYFHKSIHVEHVVTINKPAAELYRFWRDFSNLPRIMNHLESVTVRDATRSHWVAKAPAGNRVEWDAEIINDEPDRLIAWRSLGNATVDNAGSVRFIEAPGGRGTEVRVVLDYIPPAGQVGRLVAKLFGEEPKQQISEDLRRFKQVMETGEAPNVEGQSSGERSPG